MSVYTITGATGNTGKPIAEALLSAGHTVRLVARNPEKAADLIAKGAQFFQGEITDAALLTQAFTGADAVYAMIPPNMQAPDFYAYQTAAADAIATALEAAKVKYVATLSSIGVQMKEKWGVVQGLVYMEQKLNSIPGLNTLHLRASYFMENVIGQVGAVKQFGMMASPLQGDLKIPMVATADIAAYGAKRLAALDFTGHNHQYLLGPGEVTYNQIAPMFGKAIGNENLTYAAIPMEQFHGAMVHGWGTSVSMADRMCEFVASLDAGKVLEGVQRDSESTTPTSIEKMAGVFAYVYNQQ